MWYVRLLLGLGVEVLLIISVVSLEDSHFWNAKATDELNTALKIKWNEGIAKNVIIFVGDGMGITTITASRIYKGGESHKLTFEQFPHIGLLKTYVVNKQVPDSASTATSLFCGVKNNYETVGVDSSVSLNDCKTSLEKEHQLDSIMKWAQTAGKDTGFVTTTRVTHATPSALYAHVPNRRWECDAKIPAEAKDCKDIGRQLIEDEPGRSIKVIMGGGLQILKSNSSSRPGDPIDNWACKRADGKDLIQTWIDLKKKSGVRYKFLSNSQDVHTLDADNTDYVLGVFANGHMNMEHARNKTPDGMPSLEDMTLAAVKVLQKNRNGFLLMVEGGMIDFAHHRGHARMALDETVAFDQAINSTMKWLDENQILESTLVITTSDHDHALSMTGYPDRGSNILGIASKSKITGVPYTTLTYSTGEYKNYQYSVETNNSTQVVRRMDPSKNDTTAFTYSQQTGILTDEALHGGGDVAIYATGPMAHLFHNVHEQNYVAHVVAYAAKIGPYKSGASINSNITIMMLLMFIFWKVFLI